MYSEDSIRKVYYFLADIIALLMSYVILDIGYSYSFFESKFFAIIFGLLIVIASVMDDEYSVIPKRGYLEEAKCSVAYGTKVTILFAFVLLLGKFRFIKDIAEISYSFIVLLFILVSALVFVSRSVFKVFLRNRKEVAKRVLFVTDFKESETIEKELKASHYEIEAYISNHSHGDALVLQSASAIRDFVANHQVDEIIVAKRGKDDFSEFARCLKLLGIPTTVVIGNFSDFYVGNSAIKKIGNTTYLTTAFNIVRFRQLVVKRLMDIAISIVGLILTGIVAIIITPIVKKQSPGPLMFKQKRVGKNGKVFEIYKFRSMYTDAEERKKELLAQNDLDTNLMFKMEDDPRIFPFGHKLRNWSIDELPQFINVLKGDMSVVGTRPPTLDEYRHYELHHFKRLTTKPGITGLWQVSGRSDITDFEEVVALDMKYIQNWSISEDIKIIAKTFKVVLMREGSR